MFWTPRSQKSCHFAIPKVRGPNGRLEIQNAHQGFRNNENSEAIDDLLQIPKLPFQVVTVFSDSQRIILYEFEVEGAEAGEGKAGDAGGSAAAPEAYCTNDRNKITQLLFRRSRIRPFESLKLLFGLQTSVSESAAIVLDP